MNKINITNTFTAKCSELEDTRRFVTFTELMVLTKSQEEDYRRYYKDTPDDNFSPQRHKDIIDRTIRKNDEFRKRKKKDYIELIKERANVVAYYLKSKAADVGKPIDKYISRKLLAHLRGQKIVQKLRRLKSGETYIELLEV